MASPTPAPTLSAEQQRRLLEIARSALRESFSQSAPAQPALADRDLPDRGGVFVTLLLGGELRGCIGRIQSDQPLAQTVREMALRAARDDNRFEPLARSELDQITIEISVLSDVEPVPRLDAIRVGIDGLIVSRGPHRGLLLPQVPIEHGWDLETFLCQTCVKAGLEPDAWRTSQLRIERFQAQVFAERR